MDGLLNSVLDGNSLRSYLAQLWGTEKPLCFLFSTENNNYLYDTGTNKIFKCEKYEYELLELIINNGLDAINIFLSKYSLSKVSIVFNSLYQNIINNNILRITKIDHLGFSDNYEWAIEEINNKLGMMTLELSQECNLRCRYCIYSNNYSQKRNHQNLYMNEHTARASVDYLYAHSTGREDIAIGFYGGEPLLNYSVLKKTVEYAKNKLKNKSLRYSITTNGILINQEIAEYFHKEDFGVLISIDGPEDIHDLWRRDINNHGSFQRTFKGLKMIFDVYKKDSYKLGLSMVYTPPYSEYKIERIASFISSLEWIPEDVSITITYPHENHINQNKINNHEDDKKEKYLDYSLSKWMKKTFFDAYINKRKSHQIAKSLYEKRLAMLMQRIITEKPVKKAQLNGCCIPGGRKIFVTSTGEIQVCERIGLAPSLGSVFTGINIKTIKKFYLDEYAIKSIDKCAYCWLVKLCSICYQHAIYKNEININIKESSCFLQNIDTKRSLMDLCNLLEIDELGLDYLYKYKIT